MLPRNPSLDLLRGIAILMVIVAHCAASAPSVWPEAGLFLARNGQFGVQLFFIVSGYTMMLTYGQAGGPGAAASFYLRRAFRIAPMYWLAIPFYLAVTHGEGVREWAPDGVSLRDVWLTALFMQWTSPTAFNSVIPGGWSIAVEMQFYLLFPFIIGLLRRRHGRLLFYAIIATVALTEKWVAEGWLLPRMAAALPQGQAGLAEGFFHAWLPRQLICFGIGILLHDLIERKAAPALAVLMLAAASLLSALSVVGLLAAVAFTALAARLQVGWLGLLGRHSYAIYLTHFALVWSVQALWPMGLVPLLVVVTAAALALSHFLTEPLVERPLNRIGHRLARPAPEPRAATA